MDRLEFREQIMSLPVFDTHTHLNMPGVAVPAQSVWDIVHYFWFLEELRSTGYPREAMELHEDERIKQLVAALAAGRNTAWNLIVRRIFADLYGVELRDDASVRDADAAVRERCTESGWAHSVIDRLAIRRVTVNHTRDSDLPGLPGVGVAVPLWDELDAWAEKLTGAADARETAEEARAAASAAAAAYRSAGIRGMRVEADPFETGGRGATGASAELRPGPVDARQAACFLTHALLEALEEQGMFAQFFVGIQRDVGAGVQAVGHRTAMAVNDPERIVNLYPLFERYSCGFELVVGAPQNNMDAAQPARIYPNVHAGGLWWYNFRPGTYRDALQARFEAVPAQKSAIVASDARCVEWCYGKVLLVKMLLADFLFRQIEEGWIDRTDAIWLATEWLHDAPARRYLGGVAEGTR